MIALGRSYSRNSKKPGSKIGIPSIKNRWRNCIYHDIIGVFDGSETLNL